MINQLIMIGSFHPLIHDLLNVFLYIVSVEKGHDSNISFKLSTYRGTSASSSPLGGIARARHAGRATLQEFILFAYFQSHENVNFPLLKDLGWRSHTGSLWAASSPQMGFV